MLWVHTLFLPTPVLCHSLLSEDMDLNTHEDVSSWGLTGHTHFANLWGFFPFQWGGEVPQGGTPWAKKTMVQALWHPPHPHTHYECTMQKWILLHVRVVMWRLSSWSLNQVRLLEANILSHQNITNTLKQSLFLVTSFRGMERRVGLGITEEAGGL